MCYNLNVEIMQKTRNYDFRVIAFNKEDVILTLKEV